MITEEETDGGWTRLASKWLFESSWFSVRQDQVRLPTGTEIPYSSIVQPGWVLVVPITSDGRVVMERVFRYTTGSTLLECPSGGLDGEAPEVAARRELEEETGFRASSLDLLGSFFASSGISDERYFVFLARDVEPTGQQRLEETEQIEIVPMALDEAVALAASGAIVDGPSALGLLLVSAHLKALGGQC